MWNLCSRMQTAKLQVLAPVQLVWFVILCKLWLQETNYTAQMGDFDLIKFICGSRYFFMLKNQDPFLYFLVADTVTHFACGFWPTVAGKLNADLILLYGISALIDLAFYLKQFPPPLFFSTKGVVSREISTGLVLIVFTYGIQKYVDLFQFLGNTIKAHKLLLCLVSETFTAEFFPQLAGSASQEGCYCRLVHSSHLRRCWSYSDWDSVSARHLLSQSCKNTEHLKCSPKTFWKLSKRSIFWGDRGISTNTKYTK